jgi:DNA-binding transcriptional ArsR family regulator
MEGLNDPALEQVAAFFRALAVPLRLKILNALREGERNVGEITSELACSQANASKHLAVLAGSGLVEKRQSGTSTYYRIRDPRIYELCDLVCGHVGERIGRDALLHGMFANAGAKPRKATRKPVPAKR